MCFILRECASLCWHQFVINPHEILRMVPIDRSWSYLDEVRNYFEYREDETWKFPRIFEMIVRIMNYQMLKHV